LHHLVQVILEQTDTPRLRLSSLEPWDLPIDFFELWQDTRLCRHLHLPLQSGSGATLRRMGRKINPDTYANLIAVARAAIPDVAITTDIITGFPGETEAEFSESVAFVREINFTNGHVFTYSARPGTPAARLPDQVPHTLRKQRNAKMRQILADGAHTYQKQHLEQELQVLWESATPLCANQWELSGLSDNYLRVTALSASPCRNQIMRVHIIGVTQDGLVGEFSHS
jgi:threonylcarbamoyladenosine tRNA methylthiotransferase MtaB